MRKATPLLTYWPVILGAVAVLGAATNAVRLYQRHLDDEERLLQRVRVLEQIEVSEHPNYSPMIYVR